MSTPTIPTTPHHIGWKHDRVSSVISESQNGQRHFGSSPRRLLGRIQSEHSSSHCNQLSVYARRRRGRTITIVLPDPVTQDCGLVSLVAPDSKSIANGCIPEKILGIAWELPEEVVGETSPHLARIRKSFGRGQGRLLRQLSDYSPK